MPKHKNFSKAVKIHYSLSFKSANCTLSFIQTTFFLIVTTLARKVVFKEMRWSLQSLDHFSWWDNLEVSSPLSSMIFPYSVWKRDSCNSQNYTPPLEKAHQTAAKSLEQKKSSNKNQIDDLHIAVSITLHVTGVNTSVRKLKPCHVILGQCFSCTQ